MLALTSRGHALPSRIWRVRISLVAPDRRLAVAAVHHRAVGVLHRLPAARAPVASATDEWTRDAARVGARLFAPPRGDSDGLIAAISLAGIDPARVAPARVLRREGAAREGEQGDGGESRDAHGTSHRRRAV